METKICKYCPENGEQNIKNFGIYLNRGKSYHRNKCNKCRVKYQQDRYKNFPEVKERKKQVDKEHFIYKNYGLTLSEVEELKISQENKCKICEKFSDKLHIDHCHTTGKVRGLLCFSCNVGIGYFKDNINLLKNAIGYLGESNG